MQVDIITRFQAIFVSEVFNAGINLVALFCRGQTGNKYACTSRTWQFHVSRHNMQSAARYTVRYCRL